MSWVPVVSLYAILIARLSPSDAKATVTDGVVFPFTPDLEW